MSAPIINLRDYQGRDVGALREAFRTGATAVLYVLPTGGGKTFTFCHIVSSAMQHGNVAWVIVHRQELLDQCSRSLDAVGVPHGLIAQGFTPSPNARVQVCMAQTLIRRIQKGLVTIFPQLLVIDEAHHATAGTWRAIIEACKDAVTLGVTATACRTDGKGLGRASGGIFDELVCGPSIAELIAEGYLTAPVVFAPPPKVDMTGVRMQAGDYSAKETAKRMDKPTITGDAVEHYAAKCAHRPAIVFCASVAHAEHVAQQFRGAGYKAASVDGDMEKNERRGIIEALGNGRLEVLTSCDIVSEGTDIPVVAAGILLRPTASEGLYLQQAGRVLRPVYAPGFDLSTRDGRLAAIAAGPKPRAFLLDHVGNCGMMINGQWKPKHGFPDDDRVWSLAGMSKRSGRAERDNVPDVATMQCEKCYATHQPAPKCPHCGHVYTVQLVAPKVVAGELVEISAEMKADLQAARANEYRKARTRDQLEAHAKKFGYSPKWVERVLAERQKAANRAAQHKAEKIAEHYKQRGFL